MRIVLELEIRYHGKLFLSMLFLTLLLVIYRFYVDAEMAFSLLPTLFLISPVVWNIQRNKERREYLLGTLPVSVWTLGLARIAVPALFTMLAASIENYQSQSLRHPEGILEAIYLHPTVAMSIFLSGVFILYIRVIFFIHRESYI